MRLDPITVSIDGWRAWRDLYPDESPMMSGAPRLHFFNLLSGGYSSLEPRLPIPNRTVKRLSADDSAGSRVKVGHRQAIN